MAVRRYSPFAVESGAIPLEAVVTNVTAPLVSGSAATFAPTISVSCTIGAPVISGSAGLNLLNTMVGWWESSSYSGSGNLLNKGTAGSTGDMVPGASTAAPTFSGGKFSFDGSNDYMANATNVTAFDWSPRGASNNTAYGIILANPSAPNGGGTYMTKATAWADVSPPGLILGDSNGGNYGFTAYLTDTAMHSIGIGASLAVITDLHMYTIYSLGASDEVKVGRDVYVSPFNQTGTTTDSRTSGLSSASTSPLIFGKGGDGNRFINFDFYGAFVSQSALTTQNRSDIFDYFTGNAVSIGSATKYTPTASSTSSTTAPLISGTATTFTPTISSSASITAPLVSGSAALFTPVFGNTQDITTPLISGSAAKFAPAVSNNALDIGLPLISGSAATFTPTITNSTGIVSPLVSGSATTFTPTLTMSAAIAASLISGAATKFSPVVSSQINITAPLISGAGTMYSVALTYTAHIIAPLVAGAATVFLVTLTGIAVPYVPTPEPPVVQSAVETLGCGKYEVYFKSRGGDLFICRALNITKLSWSRMLNGVSEASIDFSLRGLQGDCCDCVSLINPWEHEMSIYRDGNEVWCGPVTGGEINDGEGTGRFDAKDLSAWFAKRWVEVRDTDIEFDQTDIVDVYDWLIGHAYYKDPWNMDWFFTARRLGIPIDRTYISFDSGNERWGGTYPMVDAELSTLGQSGMDYTTIRRSMLAGDLQSSLATTARFTDAHWVSPPSIIITGTGMATEVGVGGGGGGSNGWYDDQIWIERPNDAQRQQFGLLQYFEAAPTLSEEDTTGLPNAITQRAFGLRELKKAPFEYISGGSLSRHAPVTFDQLVPGRYFRVDLSQTCRHIQGNYMLTRVSVSYNDTEEDIVVDLTPPGVEKLRA